MQEFPSFPLPPKVKAAVCLNNSLLVFVYKQIIISGPEAKKKYLFVIMGPILLFVQNRTSAEIHPHIFPSIFSAWITCA
jgi:hypothetical protein